MISWLNRHLDDWSKKLAFRPVWSFQSSYPYLSIVRKRRQIWLPACMFLVLYFVYGIFEDLYQLAIIKTHFRPSLLTNILAIVFALGLAWLCFYSVMYVQNRYVKSTAISRHNWWLNVSLGIIAAWLLPTLTSTVLDISFKIKPNVAMNQQIIDRMSKMHGSAFLVIMLMSVIVGPIIEEILFRFLLIGPANFNAKIFTKSYRYIMIVFSLLFFAYEHIYPEISVANWNNTNSVLTLIIDGSKYLVMGCVFTYMYVHSNDIRTSITTHIGYNLLGTILQFALMAA